MNLTMIANDNAVTSVQRSNNRKNCEKTARFLKGPILMVWLEIAGTLPGKALQVSVVLWHLAGIKKLHTVTLSNKLLKKMGVDRFSKSRALDSLSEAGLITVYKKPGRSPVVTIKTVW